MRFNVLPVEEQRARRTRPYRDLRFLAAGLCLLGCSILMPLTVYVYDQAAQERQAALTLLQPLGEARKRYQQEEQQTRDYVKALQDQARRVPSWAALCVSLAETKPDAVQVDTLQGDGQTLTITGQCATMHQARQWQQVLSKQPSIRAATVQVMKQEKGNFATVKWELQGGTDETER